MLPLNKIINGDCIKILKQIPDKYIDVIITSPPYNIGIDYGLTYNDNKENKEYYKLIKMFLFESHRVLKDKGIVCVVIGEQNGNNLLTDFRILLDNAKFNKIKNIVWFKGLYYIPHEYILIYSKSTKYKNYYSHNDKWYSNNTFPTLWKIRYDIVRKKLKHNASFPLKIPEKLIEILTSENQIILDPFMGSGSTCIAAEKLNRKWIGIEINPEYCEIARKRLKPWINQTRLSVFNKE